MLIYTPDDFDVSLSLKFEFPYYNDVSEYEALIIGPSSAYKWESFITKRFKAHHYQAS